MLWTSVCLQKKGLIANCISSNCLVALYCCGAGRGGGWGGGGKGEAIHYLHIRIRFSPLSVLKSSHVPYQSFHRRCHRRKEGKGLLEYWPSLPGASAAASGCKPTTLKSLSGAALPRAMRLRQDRWYTDPPSHDISHQLDHSPPAITGRKPCWTISLYVLWSLWS